MGMLPIGLLSSNCPFGLRRAHAPSVGKGPGAIALTLIPCGPHSTAKDFVIACKADFDIADGTTNGDPVQTHVAKIEIIDPFRSFSNHFFPTACVT